MSRCVFFVVVALSSFCNSTANAELIVSVGSQNGLGAKLVFDAGTRATVWVHASDSSVSSPIKLDTYSLAFQIGNSTSIPGVFTNFAVDFTGGLISNAPPSGFGLETDPALIQADANPGHNIIVSNDRGTGNGLVVPGSPTRLFSLSFDIGQSAGGDYQLRFVPDAMSFGGPVNQALGEGFPEGDFGTAANTASTFFNQFTVTAVPEPGTLMLIGSACLLAVGQRFVRRKNN